MGAPTPERFQETIGRKGRCTLFVRWDQTDSDDLENAIVLDCNELSGHYVEDNDGQVPKPRFAVETVNWNNTDTVTGTLEFDSMPPGADSRVVSMSNGNHHSIDFRDKFPSGGVSDPNPLSPGNLVLTTRNAAADEELTVVVTFKEKGRRPY